VIGKAERSTRRAGFAAGFIALSVLYVAAIAAWTVHDAIAGRRASDWLSRPSATSADLNADVLAFAVEGSDRKGRSASFAIILAKRPWQWTPGRSDRVTHGESVPASAALGTLATPELRRRLANAHQIIALGISERGLASTEALYLAGERAHQTAIWLSLFAPAEAEILTLNLGQYAERCANCESPDASWMRPIAAVAVSDAAPGIDVGEALHAALSSTRNIPSPDRFSTFALARFR